jgi:D-xylonolactonase
MEGPSVAELRNGELSYLIKDLPGSSDFRFNDVIADPAGRVFCGTMPIDSSKAMDDGVTGKLYRLDTDGSIQVVVDRVSLSNGLGFTPDRTQMYYTDSLAYKIYIYDYDEETGDISNKRSFKDIPEGGGVPDGMTVDSEGYVWSASAGGAELNRYNPEGEDDIVVNFPTAKIISSVAFGGISMDEIFVTTIGGDSKEENGKDSGALFRVKLGIKGVTDFCSNINFG